MDTIERCAVPDSKEYKQALYRSFSPAGNPLAMVHAECNIERLEYVVKFMEAISIHDDVAEELTHADAQQEHEILRQSLHPEYDSNQDTGKTVGSKKAYLREVRDGMLALDPIDAPALLKELDRFLERYDNNQKSFSTMEEYLPFRIENVGAPLCYNSSRWATDIRLLDWEQEAVKDLEKSFGICLALANDLFSWRREKDQTTDRIRNAVPVLMDQYSLKEKQAETFLKGMIIEEEERAKILRMELEASNALTGNMSRYIDMMEIYVGGNMYWSATCSRYNKPQNELDDEL